MIRNVFSRRIFLYYLKIKRNPLDLKKTNMIMNELEIIFIKYIISLFNFNINLMFQISLSKIEKNSNISLDVAENNNVSNILLRLLKVI